MRNRRSNRADPHGGCTHEARGTRRRGPAAHGPLARREAHRRIAGAREAEARRLPAGRGGALALASLADGRFARLLVRPPTQSLAVTLEEARRLTEGQLLSIASYAWQASPAVYGRLIEMLQTENPTLLRTFTGALLLFALGERARRRDPIP
ncbi:MAG: hypothetical protein IPJ28_06335 [Betaproteobacteria bacterium]|nr:hypothetical protein [Betaproteobacteria bacterium]